jgi:hypothetical protein
LCNRVGEVCDGNAPCQDQDTREMFKCELTRTLPPSKLEWAMLTPLLHLNTKIERISREIDDGAISLEERRFCDLCTLVTTHVENNMNFVQELEVTFFALLFQVLTSKPCCRLASREIWRSVTLEADEELV